MDLYVAMNRVETAAYSVSTLYMAARHVPRITLTISTTIQ